MAQNEAALIKAVLRELGAIDAIATPSAEDSAAVQEHIAPVIAELTARRISPGIISSAIADGIFPDLVVVLAERVAPRFGRAADVKALLAAHGRLRELDRYGGAVTPLVRDVLDQLEIWSAGQNVVNAATVSARIPNILATLGARGIIYLADEDEVSEAVQPAVSRIVAAHLAPKPLPDVIEAAESELRTIDRKRMGAVRRLVVDPALRARFLRC